MALFGTLAGIVAIIAQVLIVLVIVQFVMSLLFNFNVISMSNDFAASIYKATNALLDPLLSPIRRLMPQTGMVDFSPMVLIVGLNILMWILQRAANGMLF